MELVNNSQTFVETFATWNNLEVWSPSESNINGLNLDVNGLNLSTSTFGTSSFGTSSLGFNTPTIDTPNFDTSNIDIPNIDAPNIEIPVLNIPSFTPNITPYPDPCVNCPNRPKPGEPKMCHCALPSMRAVW